jgi:hypothetical protein
MGDEVQKVLADHGALMTTYAPHIPNTVQVLDLSVFGIFRLIKSNADESGTVHEITDDAVNIIRAIQRSCNPPNIQAAFRKAVFKSVLVSEPAFTTFYEGRLRKTDGFREVWDIDFPMEGLNWRRQESSCGFVNGRFMSKAVSTN